MNEQLSKVLNEMNIKTRLIRSVQLAQSDEVYQQLFRYAIDNVQRFFKDNVSDMNNIYKLEICRDSDDCNIETGFTFVIFYRETGTWFSTLSGDKKEDENISDFNKYFRNNYFVVVTKEILTGNTNYVYEYYEIIY